MKKFLAILVAAMMIACLSVTAFAVTDAEVDKANLPSAELGEGKTVAPGSDVTTTSEWEIDWAPTGASEKASLKTTVDTINANDGVNASVQYLLDVGTTDGSRTAKLKFDMPDGKKLAYVLNYNAATGKWEKVEATYTNGTLTITAPAGVNWSHVAITVVNTAAGGQTSPQTGEVTTSVYVAFAALMAVAAVAFFIKSRKAA